MKEDFPNKRCARCEEWRCHLSYNNDVSVRESQQAGGTQIVSSRSPSEATGPSVGLYCVNKPRNKDTAPCILSQMSS